MKSKKAKRDLLIETNRRLQETTQELFMAKQKLEKRNKELREAREREKLQKKKFEQLEDVAMKRLARPPDGQEGPGIGEEAGQPFKRKLTASSAEDLSLKYIALLESYVKTKDLDKSECLVKEFCRKLTEYGITPKGVIGIHLKSMPQVKTMDDLETKRITFESRMVLLKVMTSYAGLLLEKKAERSPERS